MTSGRAVNVPRHEKEERCGVEQMVARSAHNREAAGSTPAPVPQMDKAEVIKWRRVRMRPGWGSRGPFMAVWCDEFRAVSLDYIDAGGRAHRRQDQLWLSTPIAVCLN